ncbi:MAG: BREX-1 system phosphatase PglZ type B [Anaerolineae bacterium]|nr:BREX-1 system phosphatase PglZ type B [Anaerolineae bacterium]
MVSILEHFVTSLRSAATYNPDVQVAPHCILWTDADRQWDAVIPRLQEQMPELYVLGDYAPEQRRGPAIWLRCVLARTIPDLSHPEDLPPVFYLPGVSRQDLRAVDNCPDHLKPLAELQYRGVIWSQVNAKDWTILAFLQSAQGGLSLDVAQDKDTKAAMKIALPNLLEATTEQFKGKRLDRDDFYRLVSGDPTSELLKWLNDGESYRQQKSDDEWRAFVELCRYQFLFNPETDGPISAAERLATRQGQWSAIWERYCEAHTSYKAIPDRIRQARSPSDQIDWRDPTGDVYSAWPQWNDLHEDALRENLTQLADQVPGNAAQVLDELERRHGHRRQLIWARLGMAPLAQALEHLKVLALTTQQVPLAGGTLDDLVSGYTASGWRADDAVMRALECVIKPDDKRAVTAAIRSVYVPWAEKAARYLQQLVEVEGYPGGSHKSSPPKEYAPGTCILFVDGLRFDIARRLVEQLESKFSVVEGVRWAAIPSVTATGKPAVSPVAGQIAGRDSTSDFEPDIAETSKTVKHDRFEKLLDDSGWTILKNSSTGDPSGRAWTEVGTIDTAGHNDNLAPKLDTTIADIATYVDKLLSAGWKRIEIVTDHGWLYVPDGLPKISLPRNLTDNQWGRCAAIKPGVSTQDRQFPWYWNPNQYFALADGISCFKSGINYAHGGVSFQECLVLNLAVSIGASQKTPGSILVADVEWRELRCVVTIEGETEGLSVDIRKQPANAESSIAFSTKEVKPNGTASLVVEDEELLGWSASVVVLSKDGQLVAQMPTKVGGDANG